MSGLSFAGSVNIVGTSLLADGSRVIQFQVSGQTATSARLLRSGPDGFAAVAALDQSIPTGTPTSLIDLTPPTGSTTYRVVAGNQPNGIASPALLVPWN
jgi:hypothetical protein